MTVTDEVKQARAGQTRRAGRFSRLGRSVLRHEAPEPITEGLARPATALREGLYRRMLAFADALTATLVGFGYLSFVGSGTSRAAALAAIPVMVIVAKVCGLYERDDLVLKKTTLDEVPRLLQLAAVYTLLLWLVHAGWTTVVLEARDVVGVLAVTFVLLVLLRGAARAFAGHVSVAERCLIVGERGSIDAVAHKLDDGRVNAEVVASLALDGPRAEDGIVAAFEELVRSHDIGRVILVPSAASDATLALIRSAKHAGVRVSLVPRMMEVVGSAVEFDHLDGLTVLGVRRFGLTRSSHALKRAFDLTAGTIALVAVAPIMLVIAVAIRIESRGPILFRQTRVGKSGRRFQMLKFRSMVVDAEERKEALRPRNETEGLFKIADDPRITRVGRVLRMTSLDELPQLLNVWRGEMSLVGPRPLVVDEDAQVQGWDRHRLHLTPGMTGHWQILGSARLPMQEMVGIDYLYVANWSLWTDVKILIRTIPYMVSRRGM